MNKARQIFSVGLVAIAFMGNAVAAEGDKVGAAELKKLIVGCTVHNMCKTTGEVSRTYFDPSGKLVRISQGNTIDGTYYIKDDGTTCNVLNGKHLCAEIYKMNDGTYHRIAPNGTRVGIWVNIVQGKDLLESTETK